MIASPPCLRTASTIRSSSVATMTRETKREDNVRRTTCITIGMPARGRRGLPGKRVELNRAGMIATASPFTGLQPIENDDGCQIFGRADIPGRSEVSASGEASLVLKRIYAVSCFQSDVLIQSCKTSWPRIVQVTSHATRESVGRIIQRLDSVYFLEETSRVE